MSNKKNRRFAKFENIVLSFIGNPEILVPRKNNSLDSMKKSFNEFSSITCKVFDELCAVSDRDPQLIIDVIRDTFSSEIFTTTITNIKKEVETITDKMNTIAMTWEISSFFKLPAYLLSGCRAPIRNLSEHSSIFKHLKPFGFSSNDIDNIRLIRNAKNHKFTISKGCLIFDDNGASIQIECSEIERIYDNLEKMSSWWLTFIVNGILYIPKFGILFCYTILEKMLKNKRRIKNYVDGLSDFVPESIINPKVKLSLTERIKKQYRILKKKFRRTKHNILYKDHYKLFFFTHGNYIFKRLAFHLEYISNEMEKISNSLTDDNDKLNFKKISSWFKDNSEPLSNISDEELYSLLEKHYGY
ncbi:MAG: hypothetical protein GF353_26060 [Candidatus Lokiarchaeota archaeon]|nr:hypothetical protein [Candidatus Lokiarchaeota archaeon]